MAKLKISNPLTPVGLFLIIGGLLSFAACQFLLECSISAELILKMSFFTSLYFTLWTVFQYHTGEITLIGQSGGANKYTRKKDKYWFFTIIIAAFLAGLFLSIVLGVEIFFDCTRSIINPCRV